MTLKHMIYAQRTNWAIIRKDLRARFPLPLPKKLSVWRKGFLAEKYTLYGLDKNDPRDYLSDYHASMARWINEPYTGILSNKFVFERCVAGTIRVPKTYGLIVNGQIHPTCSNPAISSGESLLDYCRTAPLVLKPVVGGGGAGVLLLDATSGQLECNRKPAEAATLIKQLGQLDDYLISEFMSQGGFSRQLNPATTNTLRILTIWDGSDSGPCIVRAVHRIGNSTSAPHDNFTRGGLSSIIDLQTGVLGPAATHPKTTTLKWHETHPDTGFRFAGLQIPDWPAIVDKITHAVARLPFLACVGWDIMLTDDGFCAIEGNHHPDPDVLQCHGGLLKDERIRRFYEDHGVVH